MNPNANAGLDPRIPLPPASTPDDAPSAAATVRVVAVPLVLVGVAAACFVNGWVVAGVIACVVTLACVAVEVAIGSLFIKYALRDHANMFKTLAPLLMPETAKPHVRTEIERLDAEEERRERAIDDAVGFGLTRAAARGGHGNGDLNEAELDALKANVLEERALTYAWLQDAGDWEEVSITSQDGLRLVAHRLACNTSSGSWAVLCHGYAGTWRSMLQYARRFAQNGYNLLIPDMRAHGSSEGRYIGFGYLDRRDVVSWTSWLVEQGGAPAPCDSIVLLGHSMGASSVCMAAGEDDLVPQVRAVVADCGFDSSWHAISHKFDAAGLPVHPTADLVRLSLMARRGGYDLAKGDVAAALAKTARPVLFVHGLKDTMVPPYMCRALYDAAAGAKRAFAVPGAGHCQSSLADPERYWGEVFGFIEASGR